ncbi:hypothetical protein [Aquamicrobium defluvii]|uniref:Uncharacterized protein n=1 Tax=Aquamicrobium defluvii TaxID=69279 RepID=A0A011VMT8_9HYPH|nr:hypothetical protein [Aquamicrobium defluvii]EXL09705.1 hypothetical protein BG36_20795 [Aquamicrobium defluvii]
MKPERAQHIAVTAHAAFGITQALGALLVNKGIISRDEWVNLLTQQAIDYKTGARMNADQKKAGDLLSAMVLALTTDQTQARN